jgi:hypothetical protein
MVITRVLYIKKLQNKIVIHTVTYIKYKLIINSAFKTTYTLFKKDIKTRKINPKVNIPWKFFTFHWQRKLKFGHY